jgi:Xaa-Pro aminopeptidase
LLPEPTTGFPPAWSGVAQPQPNIPVDEGSSNAPGPYPLVPTYGLAKGDHKSLLIENNGLGGFYTELSRTIVLGKASQELIDGFEIVKDAQDQTVRKLKPGTSCREIALAHNEFMKQKNVPPESRVYAHSQGYDLIERPLVRYDESMTLEKGMSMVVHPAYATGAMFAHVCDNYLVTENGASDCLHKTLKQIFEL